MPLDSTHDLQARQDKARRRQEMAAVRAYLRKLEPGQSTVVPWLNGRDPADFRRDVVWVAYLLWGAKAASVVPVSRGVMVSRHG